MENGLIHIYCGDGKGKTTAATGLAIRAAGAGMKVLIARFLKNNDSAELNILKCIPGIDILPIEKEFGFIRTKDNPVREKAREYYASYMNRAIEKAVSEKYDLFIMDEINAAVTYGVVDAEELKEFIRNKPVKMELVMTGRNPDEEIAKMADYISEIKAVKHPFQEGIIARKGIEF